MVVRKLYLVQVHTLAEEHIRVEVRSLEHMLEQLVLELEHILAMVHMLERQGRILEQLEHILVQQDSQVLVHNHLVQVQQHTLDKHQPLQPYQLR